MREHPFPIVTSKLKDLILKVKGSHVNCESGIFSEMTVTLLVQTTNKKCPMAYRVATFAITLNDLQSYSPIAFLFECDSLNIFAALDKILADARRLGNN